MPSFVAGAATASGLGLLTPFVNILDSLCSSRGSDEFERVVSFLSPEQRAQLRLICRQVAGAASADGVWVSLLYDRGFTREGLRAWALGTSTGRLPRPLFELYGRLHQREALQAELLCHTSTVHDGGLRRWWAESAIDMLNPFDQPVWLLFSAAAVEDHEGSSHTDATATSIHIPTPHGPHYFQPTAALDAGAEAASARAHTEAAAATSTSRVQLRTVSGPPVCRGYCAPAGSSSYSELVLLRFDVAAASARLETSEEGVGGAESEQGALAAAGSSVALEAGAIGDVSAAAPSVAEGPGATALASARAARPPARLATTAVDGVLLPGRTRLPERAEALVPPATMTARGGGTTARGSGTAAREGGSTAREGAAPIEWVVDLDTADPALAPAIDGGGVDGPSPWWRSGGGQEALWTSWQAQAGSTVVPRLASLPIGAAPTRSASAQFAAPSAVAASAIDARVVTIGSHAFARPTPRTLAAQDDGASPPPFFIDVAIVSDLSAIDRPSGREFSLDSAAELATDVGARVPTTLPPKRPPYVVGAHSRSPNPPAFFPWDRRVKVDGAISGAAAFGLPRVALRDGDWEATGVGRRAGSSEARWARWCRQAAEPNLVQLAEPHDCCELHMTLLCSTRVRAREVKVHGASSSQA